MVKNKKNKYFLFLVFFVAFLLINIGFANALEIKEYPQVFGLVAPSASCTGSDCLAIYIAYWFGLLIYLAGFLALISFTIGAIGMINPNPEAHNDAKDRMKGAILGLVLTVASFIIIQTINPKLITPTLTPLPGVQGVFYFNGNERKPVGLAESNVANRGEDLINGGFDRIIYDCTASGSGGTGPVLLIWEFPQPGLEGGNGNLSGARVVRKTCGQVESIGGLGSFKMDWETPGVYYYLGTGCNGYGSDANTSSQDDIGSPFRENVKSVRIVNNAANDLYYGAIFHQILGLDNAGHCSVPIATEGCAAVSMTISAVDIFMLNKNPGASGDGVSFYSAAFEDVSGARAGFYSVSDAEISYPRLKTGADELEYLWDGVNRTPAYQNNCLNFQKCPGSIKIKGNYLVALYSSSSLCQTFKRDVSNLEGLLALSIRNSLTDVYIIPTK